MKILFILRLVLPSVLGLAAGLAFTGGAIGAAALSDIFFFAALCNLLYSGALLAAGLGAFRTLSYGVTLFFKLLFNKKHEGGKKLTERYVEMNAGELGAVNFWPQGAIGAVFLALSAVFAFV